MHLQFGPKMKDIYEVEELSFCTLPLQPTNNQRTENGRFIFRRTESV